MKYYKIQNEKGLWCTGRTSPHFAVTGKLWLDFGNIIPYIESAHNLLYDISCWKVILFNIDNGVESVIETIDAVDINRINIIKNNLSNKFSIAAGNLYQQLKYSESLESFQHFLVFSNSTSKTNNNIASMSVLRKIVNQTLKTVCSSSDHYKCYICGGGHLVMCAIAFKSKDHAVMFKLAFDNTMNGCSYLNIMDYVAEHFDFLKITL